MSVRGEHLAVRNADLIGMLSPPLPVYREPSESYQSWEGLVVSTQSHEPGH